MAETVNLSPCRNYRTWSTGTSTQDAVPLRFDTCSEGVTFCSAASVSPSDLRLFMSSTFIFCVQDSVEALLFLRRRRVHRGWFSQAARPLHLGEEHRQPGEDPAWNQRRAAAGCCCKDVKLKFWLSRTLCRE